MLRDLLIFGLAIAVRTLPAQVPAADSAEQTLKLSVTAELVLLDVSVKSAIGEHVSGLTKGDFRVYEDGKIQAISHFSSEDAPVTAGLVIDASRSMQTKRTEVVTAALAFISASNRSDEIFVVHFSDGVSLGLPENVRFSDDLNQLRSALMIRIPPGRTALNDAVILSLKHLEQSKRDRNALVLISDGGDNSSVHGTGEVTRAVLESGATIYTIGIFDEVEKESKPDLLRNLARISGGESFWEVQLSAVGGICRQIASDIRTRYTIGYVPKRTGEQESLRRIRVTATSAGGHKLVVRTRTRYILPPEQPAVDQSSEASRKRGL